MAIINATFPRFQVIDANGNPLVGGKVYVYEAGTSTNLDNWTDAVKTSANTQPVILDSTGSADIWYEQTAKIDVKTADDVQVEGFPVDDLSPNIEATSSTIQQGQNLVINGSFETDANADNQPDDWVIAELSNATIEMDNAAGSQMHGEYGLKFTSTGSGAGTATSAEFFVPSGGKINTIFNFRVENAAIDASTNNVIIEWYKKDGNPSATPTTTVWQITSGAPTAYTEYKFTDDVPSDATKAKLRLTGITAGGTETTGSIWFDNVTVEKVFDSQYSDSATTTAVGQTFVLLENKQELVNISVDPSGWQTVDMSAAGGAAANAVTEGATIYLFQITSYGEHTTTDSQWFNQAYVRPTGSSRSDSDQYAAESIIANTRDAGDTSAETIAWNATSCVCAAGTNGDFDYSWNTGSNDNEVLRIYLLGYWL